MARHVDNSRFLCMHRHDSRSPQVNAHFWLRLGRGIPSISTAYAQAWRRCAQVIHMFVHRHQGSSRLVRWQAAADRHGAPVPAGPADAPRASLRDTLVLLPGKDSRPPLPGSRRPQVGTQAESQGEPSSAPT
jgi:hypothetical protein